MKTKYFLSIVWILFLTSCREQPLKNKQETNSSYDFYILQMNDVYEISGINNAEYGHLARVYYLYDSLKKQSSNLLVVHAGDFLSPTLFNRTPIKGKQMTSVLNFFGKDLVATFGNHEFDLKPKDFYENLALTKFHIISANVRFKDTTEQLVPETYIWSLGEDFKVGFLALTLPFNKKNYVKYLPYEEAVASVKKAHPEVNLWLGLTHLSLSEDSLLASKHPEIPVIFGGHEHYFIAEKVGNTTITKADANAKSVILHSFKIKGGKVSSYDFRKIIINKSIPFHPVVRDTVEQWMQKLESYYTRLDFDLHQKVAYTDSVLEGRETLIRSKQTNLGKLIARASCEAFSSCDAALINSGSIRIDDQLQGTITAYDILRTLPFGGGLVALQVKGSLLKKILTASLKNRKSGGYLQYYFPSMPDLSEEELLQKIQEEKVYTIVISEFMASGKEKNLGFLKDDKEILKRILPETKIQKDIRKAVIHYLRMLNKPLEKAR